MNTNNIPGPCNSLVPLQLIATQYGYAALLDDEGNEQPITQHMIEHACAEAALDSLYSFLPQRAEKGLSHQP